MEERRNSIQKNGDSSDLHLRQMEVINLRQMEVINLRQMEVINLRQMEVSKTAGLDVEKRRIRSELKANTQRSFQRL